MRMFEEPFAAREQHFRRHCRVQTIFKPLNKLRTFLSSRKDTVPANKRRGFFYEIPCGDGEYTYIGETKLSLSTRLNEHQRDTLPRNIFKNQERTALTKHAIQCVHGFNWDYFHVLQHENSCHKTIV